MEASARTMEPIISRNMFKEYDPKYFSILLTSHPRQQKFWEGALDHSFNNSPYFVLLGYDDVNADKIMPHITEKFTGVKEVFCTGRRSGHVTGELTQMKMGFDILMRKGFTYTLKMQADERIDNLEDSMIAFWKAIESKVVDSEEGPSGGQLIHLGTDLCFGYTGILNAMMAPYVIGGTCGAAEIFFNRERRRLNVVRSPLMGHEEDIWRIMGRTHWQGKYAQENGMNIEQTWEIGEIWT